MCIFRAEKYIKLLGFITEFSIFCKSISIQIDKVLFDNGHLLFWEDGTKPHVEARCVLSIFKCPERKEGSYLKESQLELLGMIPSLYTGADTPIFLQQT